MPEVIVLDTHIWLWLINANFEKFPAHWRDQIECAMRVGISPLEDGAQLASVDSLFSQYSELDACLMK
jgi:hypothetical protein